MAITSIGGGSAAVLLSSGGTAQQQITSVVVPRVPGGSVPAGQASRLVQLADVNSASLPGGVLTEIVGPGGERRFEIRDDLQAQISAIYDAGSGNAVLQNASYTDGVLSYTGGTLPSPSGDINGCALTVPADTQITVGYQPDTLTAGQALVYLWHTSADSATALTDYLSNGLPGLSVIVQWNQAYVCVDGVSSGSLADPGPTVVGLIGRRLQIDVPGVPNAHYETPETAGPAPAYLHIFSLNLSGGAVADAAFELSPAPSTASGLLPDETAARIAGDEALADAITDVQTLAEVNQLNILEKADQSDLDTLQTTVTGQGLTLLQKADQTALDALSTVVSGKATPADITAAISALVDGAPDALNTLSELATALAGEQAQISDLLAALALRVRVDAVQSLTLAQQLQARQNINAEAVGVAAGLVAAITPASIGAATAVQGAKADTALQSADVAPVALSGQYSALTGLPTIPGLSSATPAAPTTGGTAGTATTAARGDHAHPLPTSAQITAAVLTGLASGSATAIAAADTLLSALAKLQAQATANAGAISTNSGLLAPVDRKIGASWYVSGGWYDVEYPRYVGVTPGTVMQGVTCFSPRRILETATFTSLAFYCSTGAILGATAYAGIYSDNAGLPGSLLASFSADCSTDGTKSGAISLTLSAGQIVWDAFLLTGGAAQFFRYVVTRALPDQTGGPSVNSIVFRIKMGQTDLAATATGTSASPAAAVPRLMLQCA